MEISILRVDKDKRQNIKDIVVDEVPLSIHLNGKELVTLLCSPDNLKELSVGFLYSAGLIKSINDIENVTVDDRNRASHIELKNKDVAPELIFKRLYTSGCGRGIYFYNAFDLMQKKSITGDFKISTKKIIELMKSFEKNSIGFKKTGGVHSAALSDGEDILVFKEDIGRHSALDKVIGEALFRNLNTGELIVLVSGRISSEILFKMHKMGSPLLISRAAPTDQAIKLSQRWHITLVGFVRGERMNVYTGEERIT